MRSSVSTRPSFAKEKLRMETSKLMLPSSSLDDDSGLASLPPELLHLILDRLVSISDYVRFSAVCRHWRSLAASNKQYWRLRRSPDQLRPSRRLPLLLVPTLDGSEDSRSLYSVAGGTFHGLRVPVPPPYNKRCCGSSHGWLAIAHKIDETLAVTLYNPFTAASIRLPEIAQTQFEKYFDNEFEIKKVVLSADPTFSPDDYEAVAIYGDMRRLALYRSGDKDWIYAPKMIPRKDNTGLMRPPTCRDVIHYRGRFYASNGWGWLVSISVSGRPKPVLKLTTISPWQKKASIRAYIVESSEGDLLLVRRFKEREDFKVFKLLHSSGKPVLKAKREEEVRSLGNDALFLGDNHSMAVPATGFPGCRRNCIYYTDDLIDVPPPYPDGPAEMGVSSLEDESVVKHYVPGPLHKLLPPPIWILPTFIENLL